jgi:RNA polymerase sigma-70 factor (ECF subfamily)
MNEHRPALLRHCYRMLGSFADAEDVVQDVLLRAWNAKSSYSGAVPVEHWLMRIATNACLDELAKRKRRGLPQLEREPAASFDHIVQLEAADWLTPAPDDQLETREQVALAFLALLQRLPPRQRAVLLLKDVVGWSAEEISEALEMSLSSVNSALHRARETVARPAVSREEPAPEVLQAYVRSWEMHDLASLVTLLKDDIVFAMPPHATWFHGAAVLGAFFAAPRFTTLWSKGFRLVPVRANGQLALAFYAGDGDGFRRHSIQLVDFVDGQLAEAVHFIGSEYFRGFDLPERL